MQSTEPIGFGCLLVLISPARKRDRLENPQPPEYQVGVIRMTAPCVWFHFNSILALPAPMSQEELDLRCDSRDSRNIRKIFSLLQLCFKCWASIKRFSSRHPDWEKAEDPRHFLHISLSPMSAILTSKDDTNDTSICSSPCRPFPQRRLLKRLSPMCAKLTRNGDSNDTSCICSSPFQPFGKEGFRNVRLFEQSATCFSRVTA